MVMLLAACWIFYSINQWTCRTIVTSNVFAARWHSILVDLKLSCEIIVLTAVLTKLHIFYNVNIYWSM